MRKAVPNALKIPIGEQADVSFVNPCGKAQSDNSFGLGYRQIATTLAKSLRERRLGCHLAITQNTDAEFHESELLFRGCNSPLRNSEAPKLSRAFRGEKKKATLRDSA